MSSILWFDDFLWGVYAQSDLAEKIYHRLKTEFAFDVAIIEVSEWNFDTEKWDTTRREIRAPVNRGEGSSRKLAKLRKEQSI